jgi:hypothetical protein
MYLYGIDLGVVVEATPEAKNGRPGTIEVRLRCHKHDTPAQRLMEQMFYRYNIN